MLNALEKQMQSSGRLLLAARRVVLLQPRWLHPCAGRIGADDVELAPFS